MPIDAEIMGIVAAVLAVLGGAGVLLLSVFFRRSPPPPPTINTTTTDQAAANIIDRRAAETIGATLEQAAKITDALEGEGDDPARAIAEIMRRR